MPEKVLLRSPEGEVREVEATIEALSPLMARGWVQTDDAQVEESDARQHS